MPRNGVEFLQIQRCVLKVHIHCQGCQQKVKKLLRKIEGVYSVNIDAENQLVIVSGNVDSATLIKKLVRSGKHAELCSPSSHQKHNHGQADFIGDENNRINGLSASKPEHLFSTYLGNDLQEHWSLQNHLDQNIDTNPLTGGIDQDLMQETKVENKFATEDDIQMNFFDRTGYRRELPPSITMNNLQQWYRYNHPPLEMMHTNNNTMVNYNYSNQHHMMNYESSPVYPYKDYGFSSAPFTLY